MSGLVRHLPGALGVLAALLLVGAAGTAESPEASTAAREGARGWISATLIGAAALGPLAALAVAGWSAGAGVLAVLRRRRREARWKEVERLERALFAARRTRLLRERRRPTGAGAPATSAPVSGVRTGS